MTRTRSLKDLSIDDLRYLIIERRRAERQARLDIFSRTGKYIVPEKEITSATKKDNQDAPAWNEVEIEIDFDEVRERTPNTVSQKSKRRTLFDRFLLLIEAGAVLGLFFILFNGVSMLKNLNREVASALVQPTFTPTPLIMAVVLPSGHTPPNESGIARPNEAEIPEHLRPLVQSMAAITIPTPGPQQAIRIQISKLNVDSPIVQGDGWEQLKKGVGQRVGTPNPGKDGNIVLSAHNDIFGEIFRDLDQLEKGDQITIFTTQRTYTYIVRQTQIVEPTQVEVMAPTKEPIITLISCYPYMVDNKRIVVQAYLQE